MHGVAVERGPALGLTSGPGGAPVRVTSGQDAHGRPHPTLHDPGHPQVRLDAHGHPPGLGGAVHPQGTDGAETHSHRLPDAHGHLQAHVGGNMSQQSHSEFPEPLGSGVAAHGIPRVGLGVLSRPNQTEGAHGHGQHTSGALGHASGLDMANVPIQGSGVALRPSSTPHAAHGQSEEHPDVLGRQREAHGPHPAAVDVQGRSHAIDDTRSHQVQSQDAHGQPKRQQTAHGRLAQATGAHGRQEGI